MTVTLYIAWYQLSGCRSVQSMCFITVTLYIAWYQLSACLSVTLEHWIKTAKDIRLFSGPGSCIILVLLAPLPVHCCKGTRQQGSPILSVGINWNFRPVFCYVLETKIERPEVTIDY